ncbi:hypothetical protein Tco_0943079 [Tanacetum coccineum]|uniref:Uncharacterized protein n=1 Tax=Tanacetum coccineum TaxID=301880 RepID=A0ABQ5BVE0_9ASTR
MSIEEMRHEEQLVDYKIKEIINNLGYKRFRGEEIDEEYERDCEIRIRKLKQILIYGEAKFVKRACFEEEKHYAACPDPDDDTSSDDDDFEDVEYVSFEEVNDVEQEEKEFDLEDILQFKDVNPSVRVVK